MEATVSSYSQHLTTARYFVARVRSKGHSGGGGGGGRARASKRRKLKTVREKVVFGCGLADDAAAQVLYSTETTQVDGGCEAWSSQAGQPYIQSNTPAELPSFSNFVLFFHVRLEMIKN